MQAFVNTLYKLFTIVLIKIYGYEINARGGSGIDRELRLTNNINI